MTKRNWKMALMALLFLGLAAYIYINYSDKTITRPSSISSEAAKNVKTDDVNNVKNVKKDDVKAIAIQPDILNLVRSLEHEPVRSQLDALKDLAENSAPAAAVLAESLARCRVIPRRIETAKRLANQKLRDKNITAEQQADIILQLEKEINALSHSCSGVSKEEIMSGYDYFEKAAQLGDLDAMAKYRYGTRALRDINYGFRNPQELAAAKDRALRYAHEAVARGSVDALESLGNMYAAGFAPKDDIVRSTAYFIAAVRRGGRQDLQLLVDRRMARFSPAEASETQRIAAEILGQEIKRGN